eukprot:TRINITY_DN11755_c0_g2_i1.p1 TRINITY_DN11755_c0_g2~~TRINITY_DN11755_c0_g2_i1.p1  ORF type:complete len:945 (+),score=139.35 TRINITY_DN11755_c0_g2_i1:58-2892(+)
MGNCCSSEEPQPRNRKKLMPAHETSRQPQKPIGVDRSALRSYQEWGRAMNVYTSTMTIRFDSDPHLKRRMQESSEHTLNLHHGGVRRESRECRMAVENVVNTVPLEAYFPEPAPPVDAASANRLFELQENAIWSALKDVGMKLVLDRVLPSEGPVYPAPMDEPFHKRREFAPMPSTSPEPQEYEHQQQQPQKQERMPLNARTRQTPEPQFAQPQPQYQQTQNEPQKPHEQDPHQYNYRHPTPQLSQDRDPGFDPERSMTLSALITDESRPSNYKISAQTFEPVEDRKSQASPPNVHTPHSMVSDAQLRGIATPVAIEAAGEPSMCKSTSDWTPRKVETPKGLSSARLRVDVPLVSDRDRTMTASTQGLVSARIPLSPKERDTLDSPVDIYNALQTTPCIESCHLIKAPIITSQNREELYDDNGVPINVVQMIEDNKVLFWNGNTNLQFIVDMLDVEPGSDAKVEYDSDMKAEVVSAVVFPGETRTVCQNWNQSTFPKSRWKLETLSDEYLKWKKAEFDHYIFDSYQDQNKLVDSSWEEAQVLDEIIRRNHMFIDLWFLPGDPSLLGKDPLAAAEIPESVLKCGWSRHYLPLDSPDKVLFDRKPVSSDVDVFTSPLGNRWLLCALASMCDYNNFINSDIDFIGSIFSLCTPEMCATGGYKLMLCKDGWWSSVIVDDVLPMSFNNLAFASDTGGPHRQWIPLVEKALAKLCGSYASLTGGGCIDEALVDLTGFPVKSYSGEAWDDMKEVMIELIEEWTQKKYLIILTTPPEDEEPVQGFEKLGLGMGCGYTIIGTDEDKVLIKNPWGENNDLTVVWDEVYNLFSGLTVSFIEPSFKEIRISMPVDTSGIMYPFGVQIDLAEGTPPVRAHIHAHQRDKRLDPEIEQYGVMMVTVLGYMGDGEWIKVKTVNEWQPRDMIVSDDDGDCAGVHGRRRMDQGKNCERVAAA